MIYYIQGYLTVSLEILCCVTFFGFFCDCVEKKQKVKQFIILSTITFIISLLLQKYFWVKEFLIVTVITAIMKWYNKSSLRKNLVLTIIYQSILLMVDYIILIIYSNIQWDSIKGLLYLQSLIIIVIKGTIFLAIILSKNILGEKTLKYVKDSQWTKFLFFPIFTIYITTALISTTSYTIIEIPENLVKIIAFGLLGMNITVFYLISDISLKNKQIYEKELLQIQARNQLELYKRNLAETKKQRRLVHEYKNQLECIFTLCKTEQYLELQNYLSQLTRKVWKQLGYINTNHAIINAVLNAKYEEAIDKNIIFICKINDMSKIQLDYQDIVVLLSNLLNNAIEACQKCNMNKIIKMKIVHENNNLILSVKNTYNGEIKYKNGFMISTKRNNSQKHGLGFQNIVYIIKKNNGDYAVDFTNEEFYISIIIPQKNELN